KKGKLQNQEKPITEEYDYNNIPDGSFKKPLSLGLSFINQNQDYCRFQKQNDSTWVANDLKGRPLFVVHILKNNLQLEGYTEKGKITTAYLTYSSFFSFTFLSNEVQKQYFTFEPQWQDLPIKPTDKSLFLQPYLPDYLKYQKGDEAYFSYYINDTDFLEKFNDSKDKLPANGGLVLNLKSHPERMKPYQKPRNVEIDRTPKNIRVFYEGQAYRGITFSTRAVDFWQNEEVLNLGITFEIQNQDPNKRTLKTLAYEIRFFALPGGDTLTQDPIYKISKGINTNFGDPPLQFGKKRLYHSKKGVLTDTYQKIAPTYQIHITKLEWE
ncbi:MAG: hypothetical protein HC913_23690, partial [Microscillaceae bacterium]|nr:hypothetical protein [Microscillaceae bacterium]